MLAVMERRWLTGRLVVATAALTGPHFAHSAVLILEHAAQGAVGVVLNRPSTLPAADVVPGWGDASAEPAVVFLGGPVSPDGIVAVARAPGVGALGRPHGLKEVAGDLGVLDLHADPAATLGGLARLRLFAGYAGWGDGQLEAEIARGGWFVLDATDEDPFTPDPARLWRSVLVRQGGIFTTIPFDPSVN